MGLRGPEKKYDFNMRLTLTHSQSDFLKELSDMHGVSKREIVRILVDRAFLESLVSTLKESTVQDATNEELAREIQVTKDKLRATEDSILAERGRSHWLAEADAEAREARSSSVRRV